MDEPPKPARITTTEKNLRSLSWAVVKGHKVDCWPNWVLQGTWLNGGHCIFLSHSRHYDEIIEDPL